MIQKYDYSARYCRMRITKCPSWTLYPRLRWLVANGYTGDYLKNKYLGD